MKLLDIFVDEKLISYIQKIRTYIFWSNNLRLSVKIKNVGGNCTWKVYCVHSKKFKSIKEKKIYIKFSIYKVIHEETIRLKDHTP